MVGKKKELSGKDLKKATGGAFSARATSPKHGGTKHGPRAGHVVKPPLEGGTVQAKPRGPRYEKNDDILPV